MKKTKIKTYSISFTLHFYSSPFRHCNQLEKCGKRKIAIASSFTGNRFSNNNENSLEYCRVGKCWLHSECFRIAFIESCVRTNIVTDFWFTSIYMSVNLAKSTNKFMSLMKYIHLLRWCCQCDDKHTKQIAKQPKNQQEIRKTRKKATHTHTILASQNWRYSENATTWKCFVTEIGNFSLSFAATYIHMDREKALVDDAHPIWDQGAR